jgi:hypothetical protein
MPSSSAARLKAADRQRIRRAREHNGRIVLSVEVDETALAAVLLEAGFIEVNDQDDRQKLAAALSRAIEVMFAIATHP